LCLNVLDIWLGLWVSLEHTFTCNLQATKQIGKSIATKLLTAFDFGVANDTPFVFFSFAFFSDASSLTDNGDVFKLQILQLIQTKVSQPE